MSDITANLVIGMPAQLFTLARSFKANANGKIYIGQPDTDPTNPANQIQVYVENEDGSHVPVAQPIIINNGGFPVLGGQIKKFVTVQNYSMAIYDAYNAQQFYFEDVAKYDPDQLRQQLEDPEGAKKYPELHVARWRDEVNVKGWGAKGDYITDDRAAIIAADAYAASIGAALYFPSGAYRCSDGIDKMAQYWVGEGAPRMGTFPTIQDDKRFLRPGYKHLIPGSCLVFSGTGTKVGSTSREAPFDSFTYMVKDGSGNTTPSSIRGLGIVMDMDVLTADGSVTTPFSDNRASYSVGLFCNDVTKGYMSPVVFGYFPVAGILHYGSDPDATTFADGASSGAHGFVILGTGTNGLSQTTIDNWELYANDHHSRPTNVDRGNCLVIDGGGLSINGHYIRGGRVQTYGIDAVVIKSANNVSFSQVVFELPDTSGDPFASDSRIISDGTAGDVYFDACRFTDNPIYGADRLSGQMAPTATLFMDGGLTLKGVEVTRNSTTTRLRSDGNDNWIQLTADATSGSAGWILRRRGASADDLQFMYNNVLQEWVTTGGRRTLRAGLVAQQSRSSVTVPAIQLHSSDTMSGFYSNNANTVGITIGGVAAWLCAGDQNWRPGLDNAYSIGSPSFRASVIYAGTGSINTSDETLKTRLQTSDAEKAAALEIKADIWKFQFKDSVEGKGADGARYHFGVGAQSVGEIMRRHGLDPEKYAFFCHDVWEQQTRPVMEKRVVVNASGEAAEEEYETGEVEVILEAGSRYGIRYEELLCFIIAAM